MFTQAQPPPIDLASHHFTSKWACPDTGRNVLLSHHASFSAIDLATKTTPIKAEPERRNKTFSYSFFSAVEREIMEGALAAKTVMIAALVAHCGAVPTTSPSQEELSKAQVKRVQIMLFCLSLNLLMPLVFHTLSTIQFLHMKRKSRFAAFKLNSKLKTGDLHLGSAL